MLSGWYHDLLAEAEGDLFQVINNKNQCQFFLLYFNFFSPPFIDFFKKDQVFIILEFEFGGNDLESCNGKVSHAHESHESVVCRNDPIHSSCPKSGVSTAHLSVRQPLPSSLLRLVSVLTSLGSFTLFSLNCKCTSVELVLQTYSLLTSKITYFAYIHVTTAAWVHYICSTAIKSTRPPLLMRAFTLKYSLQVND